MTVRTKIFIIVLCLHNCVHILHVPPITEYPPYIAMCYPLPQSILPITKCISYCKKYVCTLLPNIPPNMRDLCNFDTDHTPCISGYLCNHSTMNIHTPPPTQALYPCTGDSSTQCREFVYTCFILKGSCVENRKWFSTDIRFLSSYSQKTICERH